MEGFDRSEIMDAAADLCSKIESIEKQVHEVIAERDELTTEVDELTEQLDATKTVLDKIATERDELRARLEAAREAIRDNTCNECCRDLADVYAALADTDKEGAK